LYNIKDLRAAYLFLALTSRFPSPGELTPTLGSVNAPSNSCFLSQTAPMAKELTLGG